MGRPEEPAANWVPGDRWMRPGCVPTQHTHTDRPHAYTGPSGLPYQVLALANTFGTNLNTFDYHYYQNRAKDNPLINICYTVNNSFVSTSMAITVMALGICQAIFEDLIILVGNFGD